MKKLNYKKTFLLGFGFFAVSITWSVYNAWNAACSYFCNADSK
ncbi:hypothetical protein [Clostridium pasteurianum]|nr:hypothetical protein [Clostridium pasteurianum]